MLNFLRKKTKIIIWTVLVAFITWGGYAVSVQFQDSQRAPGKIFGKEISFREFQLAHQAVQVLLPAAEADEPPSPETLENRTWEFLILSHEARHRKIQVNDTEVRSEIARLLAPRFPEGLGGDAYTHWVRTSLRQEPQEFEKQVREHLRIRKLLIQAREGMAEPKEESLKNWLLELFGQARLEVYR